MDSKPGNAFEQAAHASARLGLLGEFWQFLRCNKKWWLAPLIMLLLLMGLLLAFSGSAAAPFIYTLF
jgi:hypothetical protein